MKRLLPLIATIPILLAAPAHVLAWDGNWTNARSGTDFIYDPDSTQGQSGVPDTPLRFPTPPTRTYADVDPDELQDYYGHHKRDYTPYALARITQDIHYNEIVIPKGYYLIKPGHVQDGSPRVNFRGQLQAGNTATSGNTNTTSAQPTEVSASKSLPFTLAEQIQGKSTANTAALYALPPLPPTLGQQPVPLDNTTSAGPSPAQNKAVAGSPSSTTQASPVNPQDPVYRVFILKRLGKVIAIFPIHQVQYYKPARDEKVPKQALAWLETENRHPVLKFYYQKRIYSTNFQ